MSKLCCNDIMMLTPSGGVTFMNESPSTSISDHFGNVTDVNKTISFQMTVIFFS